ncbi:thiol-disulfide oxidoreductase DCC family protein [Brevibacillus dissolubilis]|uniref:thiol-disulfide oxidoreductase DCC family protein n=1 Tax=Brevibacillus dissolubilis TaxID=1844116 RepID=UPI0011167DC0|nr:DUF393 domain-containing protein [Brevibacillus dissolubilis]
MQPITVYVDETCNLCQFMKRTFMRIRHPRRAAVVEWRHYHEAPCGIGDYNCGDAMKVQTPDGQLYQGFYAVRVLVGYTWLAFLQPLLYIPGIPPLGEKAYAWVARNRYRLFGKREG